MSARTLKKKSTEKNNSNNNDDHVDHTEKKTGVVCPHCHEFIPEKIQSTLKLKVAWYLHGKDPKKGAKPIKIIRYPKPPTVDSHMMIKDSVYVVTGLHDTEAGEAYGFIKMIKKGSYEQITTRVQDNEQIVEKNRNKSASSSN